jgi:2-phosphoglycerate kinase
VLLLGGPSGVGKTIIARQLGLRLGISWLQVDDLRLALQRSRVTLPRETAALYFFEETPNVWNLPPERLRDGLIAIGEVISPAIEVVITNHVDTQAPLIIEGDGILPSLFARPEVRDRAASGHVRAVFLVEPEEEMLFTNMLARKRGIAERTEEELRTEARTKWLYGQWLTAEAQRYGLPVLESRPWSTLLERLIMHKSS